MVVFEKCEDLIDYTCIMTDNIDRYPKKYRFTFVNRMQNLTLDAYDKLSKANEIPVSERRSLQLDALGHLNVLLALIKISLKRGFIDMRQTEIWTAKVSDVKNLTAAWMKKTR